jgi:hypothetical protein
MPSEPIKIQRPREYPQVPDRMPMLLCLRADEFINAPANAEANFRQRIDLFTATFAIAGDAEVEEDRAIIRSGNISLEIFAFSDSVWATDHNHVNVDVSSLAGGLPSEKEAKLLAAKHLREFNLMPTEANSVETTYAEASALLNGEPIEPVRTAIDVHYTLRTPFGPIFGPGAKIKVTLASAKAALASRESLAQIVYFNREWKLDDELAFAPLQPKDALDLYERDPSFAQLSGETTSIVVEHMELGYFALPPGSLQRYYLPVWAVDATIKSRVGDRPIVQRLQRFVLARDLGGIQTGIDQQFKIFD